MTKVFMTAFLTLLMSYRTGAWASSLAANQQGRPIVVFIHGRDQAGEDPEKLRSLWYEAFESGEKALGVPSLVPEEDRRFIWYGDIYGKNPPPIPNECKFAMQFTKESIARADESNDRVRRALIRIARLSNLEGIAYKLFVNDTYHFFSDITYRCMTDQRLSQVLDNAFREHRPIVLVAHSMGAIVAFGVLQENSQRASEERYNVVHLVTAGAQIGVPEILRAIQGSIIQPPVPVPQNIRRWTNFVNKGDKLAFSTRGKFKATEKQREPVEVPVNAPGPARHSIASYLSQPEVARTIITAWCNALAEPTESSTTACQKVLGPVPRNR